MMMKKYIKFSTLAVLSFSLFTTSCKDDRDMQESLKSIEAQAKEEMKDVVLNFDGKFAIDPIEVDVVSENVEDQESLRSLKFKFTADANDLKAKRNIEFQFEDGDELDAMLIMRCTGGDFVAADDTQDYSDANKREMSYYQRLVKLVYHSSGSKSSKHKGAGYFTCKENRLAFSWNGKDFEDVKNNTATRKWQIMLALSKGVKDIVPASGNIPSETSVSVGDNTFDNPKPQAGVNSERPYSNLHEIERMSDFKPMCNYATGATNDLKSVEYETDKYADEYDVPFWSEWRTIKFSRFKDDGKKFGNGTKEGDLMNPPKGTDQDNKPVYKFDVIPENNPVTGVEEEHLHLKPRGVFVLIDLKTANKTPFDIIARGLHIETTTYSFFGNLNFSEQAMRKNGGAPLWEPSTEKEHILYTPSENISRIPIFSRDFQFVKDDANTPIVFKGVKNGVVPTPTEHAYLFWAMPNDIKSATEDDYYTAMFLRCDISGDFVVGDSNSDEHAKWITTNWNIRKYDEGKVAAVMPSDGRGFNADDILDGKYGRAKEYVQHGFIANRNVWLHMPSIKNFPLYSSTGKCVFSSDDEAAKKGKANALKHGRIMYAKTQALARPIMFLEYMSETPAVNTETLFKYSSRLAADYNNGNGNYWRANVYKDGTNEKHNDLFAYRMTPHWNINSFNSGARDNDARTDEFHFSYQAADDLAKSEARNKYGYQKHMPTSIEYGTYFRETIAGRASNTDLESFPSPLIENGNLDHTAYWFHIRFANNQNDTWVLEDQGVNNPLLVADYNADNDYQLWKIVNNTTTNTNQDDIEIINKATGGHIYFKDGKFYSMPLKGHLYITDGTLVLNGERCFTIGINEASGSGSNVQWVKNTTKTMNPSSGLGLKHEIGLYGFEDNNSLSWISKENGSQSVRKWAYKWSNNPAIGGWKRTQNFPSRLGFETEGKYRPTCVRKAWKIVYAVRYMDHKNGKTCHSDADARKQPEGNTFHEDGMWENCNKRRCVVRYQQGVGSGSKADKALYSITARYVGQNDALASVDNPIWAEEDFWIYNKEDDVVRYYTKGYGYQYVGGYLSLGDWGGAWTEQPALSDSQDGSLEVLLFDCGLISSNYGTNHPYANMRGALNEQDRIPFYLMHSMREWNQKP